MTVFRGLPLSAARLQGFLSSDRCHPLHGGKLLVHAPFISGSVQVFCHATNVDRLRRPEVPR